MKLFTVSNNHTTRTVPYVAEIGSIWTMVVLKPEQGGGEECYIQGFFFFNSRDILLFG